MASEITVEFHVERCGVDASDSGEDLMMMMMMTTENVLCKR